jgi:hypothetical protein
MQLKNRVKLSNTEKYHNKSQVFIENLLKEIKYFMNFINTKDNISKKYLFRLQKVQMATLFC